MLFLTSKKERFFRLLISLIPLESNLLLARFNFSKSKNLSQIIVTLVLVNRLSLSVIDFNWENDCNCMNYSSCNWQLGRSIYKVDWVIVTYRMDTRDMIGTDVLILVYYLLFVIVVPIRDYYYYLLSCYEAPLPIVLLLSSNFLTLSNSYFNSYIVFSILVLALNNSLDASNKLVSACCMSSIIDCNSSFYFLYSFIFFYLSYHISTFCN